MGKRLGDLTKNNTKCMVEVNGVKLIDRMINQLAGHNLTKLIIVTGYKGDELKEYLGHRYDDILKIEYIDNPIYDRTNNIYSLFLARDLLTEDDTILLESDIIVESAILDKLIEHPDPDLALVAKYESWMDGTVIKIDDNRRITNFIPKQAFNYDEVDEYYKTVNIYKFSKDFSTNQYVPFLDAYSRVMGNNEYYEQVLRVLTLLHHSTMKALPAEGLKWYEIDDIQDLDIASTIFSAGEIKYNEYHKRYGGFWRFPQLLDYCYLVNPFFPGKKMRDELKTNFDMLLDNYPSGMAINSLLAGKYFGVNQDYVVVGNGAAELIKSLTEYIEDSTTGVIFPTFDEYPNRLPDNKIVPFIVDSADFSYTADQLMDFFSNKNISNLLLINPDNPSGHFMPINDVIRLAEWAKQHGIRLIVDESFVDFTDNHKSNTLLHDVILEENPGLIVMKSISKSYGVPGLRLGVLACSDKNLIRHIRKDVSIWNINSFAEFYMQIFTKYEREYEEACGKFRAERQRFYQLLSSIPYLRVIPSQANYFLCEVISRFTSAELTQKLINQDVIISNCALKRNMQGRQLIRLAIRSPHENDRLIGILKSLQ